jgi:2'-5' RNA ligase
MSPGGPFPADEPSNLRDADAIRDNDWRAFSGLSQLTDHWSRPGWPDGARAFYWLISLGGYPELTDRARQCLDPLLGVGDFDPVPMDLLHLTLVRVAAVSDLDAKHLADICTAAREPIGRLAPIRLSVGPLAGSAGAVRFSVTPWEGLFQLRRSLTEARLSAPNPPRDKGFRPHVSIAYNRRRRPAEPVTRAVGQLRHLPVVDITITAAELVELRRDGRAYRWNRVDRMKLGSM